MMKGSPTVGDRLDFIDLVEPHRKALLLHCYRMLGSIVDAEDLVQETMLRAWRSWDSYRGDASIRIWLYRIATNACLDHLRKRQRRVLPQTLGPPADPDKPLAPPQPEVTWLEPYPDELLPDEGDDPQATYEMHESVSLAFQAVVQLLPPRQRAALILCEVLGWTGHETAELLGTSVSAVDSALYRARNTLRASLPSQRVMTSPLDLDARLLLDRYLEAWHRTDVDGLVSLLVEDALLAMPPTPSWFVGRESIAKVFATVAFGSGNKWRLVPAGSNMQPGFVFYAFDPEAGRYRAAGVQVIGLKPSPKGPQVSEIIAFMQPGLSQPFRHPATLPA